LVQNLKPSSLKDAAKPQPVHRLDYGTTGVLLIGKTNESIRKLNLLFETKKISKIYFATTIGKMDNNQTLTNKIDGKIAETEYKIIKTVNSVKYGKLNLVKLNPKTGRRHQIRKHLSLNGNPILGDKDYGKEGFILQKKGMYLHAYSLNFIHPYTKKEMHIISELPSKYTAIFEK